MKSINYHSKLSMLEIMRRNVLETKYYGSLDNKELPYLSFPKEFLVKLIWPRGGATARFLVTHKDKPETKTVSVYLDCHGALGAMDDAYWEIYPNVDGDTERFIMGKDETAMMDAIFWSLS